MVGAAWCSCDHDHDQYHENQFTEDHNHMRISLQKITVRSQCDHTIHDGAIMIMVQGPQSRILKDQRHEQAFTEDHSPWHMVHDTIHRGYWFVLAGARSRVLRS